MSIQGDALEILNQTANTLYKITQDEHVSAGVWRAATVEFGEVNHRLMVLMGVKFSEDAAGLAKLAADVDAAKEHLDVVLANIRKAEDVVDGVTKFLVAVDKFVDFAKTAAAKGMIP
jgi:hypothetical protein